MVPPSCNPALLIHDADIFPEKYPGPDGARNLLTDFEGMPSLSFRAAMLCHSTDSFPEKYGGRPTRASIDRTNAFIAETYRMYTYIPSFSADGS